VKTTSRIDTTTNDNNCSNQTISNDAKNYIKGKCASFAKPIVQTASDIKCFIINNNASNNNRNQCNKISRTNPHKKER